MTRRDHILIAVNAAGFVVALPVLGAVLDTSPHTWVTAAYVVAFVVFGLLALFLASAAITAAATIVGRGLRRGLRHTVGREQMTRRRSGGSVRRRHSPMPAATEAAERDVLFDEYAEEFLAEFTVADEARRVTEAAAA